MSTPEQVLKRGLSIKDIYRLKVEDFLNFQSIAPGEEFVPVDDLYNFYMKRPPIEMSRYNFIQAASYILPKKFKWYRTPAKELAQDPSKPKVIKRLYFRLKNKI